MDFSRILIFFSKHIDPTTMLRIQDLPNSGRTITLSQVGRYPWNGADHYRGNQLSVTYFDELKDNPNGTKS